MNKDKQASAAEAVLELRSGRSKAGVEGAAMPDQRLGLRPGACFQCLPMLPAAMHSPGSALLGVVIRKSTHQVGQGTCWTVLWVNEAWKVSHHLHWDSGPAPFH